MAAYRIYGLDERGRIRFGDFVACSDDGQAMAEAQRLLARYAKAEVWLGQRRVAGPDEVRRPNS
jgi:hypothetical protein